MPLGVQRVLGFVRESYCSSGSDKMYAQNFLRILSVQSLLQRIMLEL